jgi:hypothetical protein
VRRAPALLLVVVALVLTAAVAAEAATIKLADAKSHARKRAKAYASAFAADGYKLRACGRRSSTKALCVVRIVGYHDGAYSCTIDVAVTLRAGALRSRVERTTC